MEEDNKLHEQFSGYFMSLANDAHNYYEILKFCRYMIRNENPNIITKLISDNNRKNLKLINILKDLTNVDILNMDANDLNDNFITQHDLSHATYLILTNPKNDFFITHADILKKISSSDSHFVNKTGKQNVKIIILTDNDNQVIHRSLECRTKTININSRGAYSFNKNDLNKNNISNDLREFILSQ